MEKISLALESAEKNFIYYRRSGPIKAEHIMALDALFESFLQYGCAASQIEEAICRIEEGTYIFRVLIEPHLRIVDDKLMIAKPYVLMYVQYIAKIAQGASSKEAVEKLFAK